MLPSGRAEVYIRQDEEVTRKGKSILVTQGQQAPGTQLTEVSSSFSKFTNIPQTIDLARKKVQKQKQNTKVQQDETPPWALQLTVECDKTSPMSPTGDQSRGLK